ncbi:MAG: S8 family serine peptidase [Lishizhenia sp.]
MITTDTLMIMIGWNFPLSSNDTRLGDNEHGTLISGIASAKGNNSIGTAGIAGGLGSVGVKIVPCNTENPNPLYGGVMQGVVDDAIYYAVDAGCKIINFSLTVSPSADITDAIDYAYSQVVTMIAASRNDNYFVTAFPAGHIKTIAVGGFDQNSQKFATSNYGHTLDIAGPAATGWGPFITSNTYGESGGTSVAAPVVSGIAALMLTQNPCLGPRQIKEILTATATKIGGYNYNYQLERPGKSLELGYGAINAEAAIQEAIYFQDNSYDLYMRDRYNDAGRDEGYTWTWDFDASAVYNWYNEEGVLIHSGRNFTVTSEISKKYKLEVIAESDLYKDYDEIELKIKENYLKGVIPNPVDDICTINYKLKANTTGVLTVAPVNSQQSVNSYLINDTGSISIDLNSLTSGFYQILLITNGIVQDTKTIFKN